MTIYYAILLAIIQGLTEFLPVSSSAHLALAQMFLPGFAQPGLAFDVVVHLGTLSAVVVYFRKDIARLFGAESESMCAGYETRFLIFILVGSAPTGILGLLFRKPATAAFEMPLWIGVALVITGTILFLSALKTNSELFAKPSSRTAVSLDKMNWKHAFAVGVFQGIAVFPGISRSGATVAGGILLGLDRRLAFMFSFLLSVPAILGATALEAPNIVRAISASPQDIASYITGFVLSAITGYFALWLFARALLGDRLNIFAYYCYFLAGISIVMGVLR